MADSEATFPFTQWLEEEGVYACEECGAWAPESGDPIGHNRTCKYAFQVWADAAARAGLRDLPEGKQMLYVALDGAVVLVAKDEAADELWDQWVKPRLVNNYVNEVRNARDETPTAPCPRCGEMVEDHDGFGTLVHSDYCGYCSHPSITGQTCDSCGITWPAVEPIDGEVDALRANVIAAAKILVYRMRERTASTATWQALGDAVDSLEAGAPRQACKRDSTKQCSSLYDCYLNGCQL